MVKRQVFSGFIVLVFTLMLWGCGSSDTNGTGQPETQHKQNTVQKQSKYPFPEGAEIKGNGQLIISTPSGTSEDGSIPILFVNENVLLIQIGADLMDWEGDKEVFFYIDEFFVEAQQGGEMLSVSLDLEGDHLKPGLHTVSAVQFVNNDPSKGVVSYQQATFEIKAGS